jgi:hypothetical protein
MGVDVDSKEIEEAYRKEAERIFKKVQLGELSKDEGDFLLMQIKEKSRKTLGRLKRPSRLIFYVLSVLFAGVFLYAFFALYASISLHDADLFPLYVLGASVLVFLGLFQGELRRIETLFARFFSKAYFQKLLYAPELELELQQGALIQVHIQVKSCDTLYAGLNDEQVWELKSKILTLVTQALDDGIGVFEESSEDRFMVNYALGTNGRKPLAIFEQVQSLFSDLKLMEGQWFARSVHLGAAMVFGDFWYGSRGQRFQVFGTTGSKRGVGLVLAEAADWGEILLDEECAQLLQDNLYLSMREPVFQRAGGEMVQVYRFENIRDAN